MLWRYISEMQMMFCPECHHGKPAHMSATRHKPVRCVGAKDRFFDHLSGQITGDGKEGKLCGCRYTLEGLAGPS